MSSDDDDANEDGNTKTPKERICATRRKTAEKNGDFRNIYEEDKMKSSCLWLPVKPMSTFSFFEEVTEMFVGPDNIWNMKMDQISNIITMLNQKGRLKGSEWKFKKILFLPLSVSVLFQHSVLYVHQ